MAMEKNSPCPYTDNGLPHWKFVLCFCDKCSSMVIPSHESNKYTTNTCQEINFTVCRNASCCTLNDRLPYKELTTLSMCYTMSRTDMAEKVYT